MRFGSKRRGEGVTGSRRLGRIIPRVPAATGRDPRRSPDGCDAGLPQEPVSREETAGRSETTRTRVGPLKDSVAVDLHPDREWTATG